MLRLMSAMLIAPPGVVLLTIPAHAAAELKVSLQLQPTQGLQIVLTKARALIKALKECSELSWGFNVRELKDEADENALRRELTATLDYLRIARAISSGEAGRDLVELVGQLDLTLATELTKVRENADKALRDVELALRFLLEDDDPNGEIEQAFSLRIPSDDARSGTPIKLDLSQN